MEVIIIILSKYHFLEVVVTVLVSCFSWFFKHLKMKTISEINIDPKRGKLLIKPRSKQTGPYLQSPLFLDLRRFCWPSSWERLGANRSGGGAGRARRPQHWSPPRLRSTHCPSQDCVSSPRASQCSSRCCCCWDFVEPGVSGLHCYYFLRECRKYWKRWMVYLGSSGVPPAPWPASAVLRTGPGCFPLNPREEVRTCFSLDLIFCIFFSLHRICRSFEIFCSFEIDR